MLHVGHLHSGRNVEILEHITEDKQVVLVVSSVSKQDQNLRKRLNAKQNVRIIDQYLPDIQEIYQLSDIYLFPVENEENCIDVPLSVLEAAACNTPIVTTAYGELTQFAGRPGIMFEETMDPDLINSGLDRMLDLQGYDNRSAVEQYDWDRSVRALKALME